MSKKKKELQKDLLLKSLNCKFEKKLKLVPTVDNISDLSSDEDNKILFKDNFKI